MFNFTFHNPTRIIFGKDTIAQLHKYVPIDARVLVLYGGGSVLRNGVLAAVRSALAEGPGRKVFEFAGIEPNPHFETCLKAIDLIRAEQCDFLLAVGGGSVIDATKFIAGASALPQSNTPKPTLGKSSPATAKLSKQPCLLAPCSPYPPQAPK